MASTMSRYTSLRNNIKTNVLNRFNTANALKNNLRLFSSEKDENTEFIEKNPDTEIDKLRDVSRMKPHLRKELRGETLFYEDSEQYELSWVTPIKLTNKKAKYFGKYGVASGINPGILWPTSEELKKIKEKEEEFFPTLQVMMTNVKQENENIAQTRQKRVFEVSEKMKKLEGWINDLEKKKQKKLDDAKAQKEKREKLLDEVRAHFGYVVDPQDAKFKELLAEKEKEERKAKKEAKKKEYIAKELAKIQAMTEKAKKEMEKRSAGEKLEVKNGEKMEKEIENGEINSKEVKKSIEN